VSTRASMLVSAKAKNCVACDLTHTWTLLPLISLGGRDLIQTAQAYTGTSGKLPEEEVHFDKNKLKSD
jgi:hypothetical protein